MMKEKGNKKKEDSKSESVSLNFLNKGLEYLTLKGHIERKMKGRSCRPLTWCACVNRHWGGTFSKGKTLLMATRDKRL